MLIHTPVIKIATHFHLLVVFKIIVHPKIIVTPSAKMQIIIFIFKNIQRHILLFYPLVCNTV